jgi:hypothetical protein
MRASDIPSTLALERQARRAARRDGKILRKCGDDRYLIICPQLNEVRPREGTFTLLDVIRWFENEPRDHERPEGPFWPAL